MADLRTPIRASSCIAAERIEAGSRSVYHRNMKSLLVLAPAVFLSLVSVHAQALPEGAGKSVFENTCGGCHGADIVIGQTGTREVWQDTVDSMRGRGATGSDEDFKVIVDYLTKNFGPPARRRSGPRERPRCPASAAVSDGRDF